MYVVLQSNTWCISYEQINNQYVEYDLLLSVYY